MLGRFLEKKGYTSLAPHYKGHGVPPEELIQTGPEEWWEDVLSWLSKIKEAGYDEIAVAGLSLGGVFSLKLGYNIAIKGYCNNVCPDDDENNGYNVSKVYSNMQRNIKSMKVKMRRRLKREVDALREQTMPSLSRVT